MALSIGNANLSLTEHLSAPPKASLQILGTHNVNEDNNIIDFDIWVDCSKTVGIRSAKFLTENDVESRCWSYSADCDNGDPKDILGGWLDDWLNHDDADDQRSVLLDDLVQLPRLILTNSCRFSAGVFINLAIF